MRKSFSLLILAGLVTIAGIQCHTRSGPQAQFRPYHMRHAIVRLEYVGQARGYEEIYIDSFGVLEARHGHSEVMIKDSIYQPNISYSLKRGSDVTIIDSLKGSANHFVDKRLDSLYKLPASDVPSPEEAFAAFFSKHFRQSGDTTIAGVHARIWRQLDPQVTLVEWGGLILVRQVGPPGLGMELRTISIDTVTPIDPARFAQPAGIPLTHTPANSLPH